MAFRELIFKPLKNKNGYLYIRESEYVRDKRTLKRKPKSQGDGTSLKNRNQWNKKKEIYCGKIIPIENEPKLITFQEFIINHKKLDVLNFRLNSEFDEILDTFEEYLRFIYDIDKEYFYSEKPKKVFDLNGKLFGKETLNWVRDFEIKKNPEDPKEIERFVYRCDCVGIYDDEIKQALYLKLSPEFEKEDIEKSFQEESVELENMRVESLRDFIQKTQM